MPDLRIVSLISSATEMLYALGLGENVVAVSHECDWPLEVAEKPRATVSNIDASRSSGEIDQQVKQRLAVGEPLYRIDGGLIASLRPDLIVTQAQCDVCAVRLDDVRAMIAQHTVLRRTRLVSLQPNRLQEIFEDIQRVGEATGRKAAADRFESELQARIDRVRHKAAAHASKHGRRRVAIIEWTDPLMLAGNWTPEMVELAGGYCPLTTAGEHSRYHDWSEVAAFDPEVIVVAPCGFDLQRSIQEARSLEQLPDWHKTPAACAGRIFALDGNAYLNRSGPRIVDTLEILAELFWGDNVPAAARRLNDTMQLTTLG